MNRKATSKHKREVAKRVNRLPVYDDPMEWLRADFTQSPWPQEKIDEFQKRLDSAFGGENAIILAWSGDRKYGDAFYTDWHSNGLPKGKLERKPVLLFAEEKINEHDYFYLTCPRWLLLEVHHGSELEASWEASSWTDDNAIMGGRKRIRAEKPPQYFYEHLKVIAEHDQVVTLGEMPPCCVRLLQQNRICYGRYREPSDIDVAYVRRIRENMDRAGVSQRNDAARSAKVLQDAALSTKHFMKRAQEQKALHVQNVMLENVGAFFGDILENKGSTMSLKEAREIVKEAFDEQNQERFA